MIVTKVELQIDSNCTEPRVIIVADRLTPEISELMERISPGQPDEIPAFDGEQLVLLHPDEIIRVYAEKQQVIAQTEKASYKLRSRLYELEQRLDAKRFVRISNSEIINIKRVISMDLSIAGTICVRLRPSIVTYVSRRYIPKIKQTLGI